MDCLFCKIIDKSIPAKIAYEDDNVLAFHDISPQAPHHILIIPKKHIATLNDIKDDDIELIGKMTQTAKNLAIDLGIDQSGYRLVWNCNKNAGQAVFHIHCHLLGGRHLMWPPG